jgi:hypothetical protein
MKNIFRFKPTKEVFAIVGFMVLCWFFNFIADKFRDTNWFYLFYEGIFALGICISLPLYYTTILTKKSVSSIGIKSSNWKKSIIIGVVISSFLFAGRLMGMELKIANNKHLISIIICMMFSSLFEEVFFRGFLQSRFEDFFGIIPSVLLSAICFALYHSAQRFVGFDLQQLTTLFIVGIVFGITYRLTRNIITSFIVNLPQAVLTFIGENKFIEYGNNNIQSTSANVCIISIIIAVFLIVYFAKQSKETSN